jgi:hypothetical protein
MLTRKLEKSQWRSFLEYLSEMLEGAQAEIEVASLSLGDQIEAEWLPLLGITYDPKADVVEVALEGHDHIIYKPRELYFAEDPAGLTALEVVDAEGARQIIKLREPLMLPAPQH